MFVCLFVNVKRLKKVKNSELTPLSVCRRPLGADGLDLDLDLDPELHWEELMSVIVVVAGKKATTQTLSFFLLFLSILSFPYFFVEFNLIFNFC